MTVSGGVESRILLGWHVHEALPVPERATRMRTRVERHYRTTPYKKAGAATMGWEEGEEKDREREMSGSGARTVRGAEEQQGQQRREEGQRQQQEQVEGLPQQSSPYVKYSDLEDYKQQAYGTEGHQPVKEGRGPGATDAPTFSGSQAKTVDDIHRGGTS